jgi:hypothetical protein
MTVTPAGGGPPDALSVDALTAALRADVADLDIYARVLSDSLTDALPTGMVTVDRDRSLTDRLAGRPGLVAGVSISVGDWRFDLVRTRSGVPEAHLAQRVRGVVISSRPLDLDDWVSQLAGRLAEQARASAVARAALGRLLGQPG